MNEIPKKSLLVIITALGRREGGKSRIGFKHSSRLVRNCVMHNNRKDKPTTRISRDFSPLFSICFSPLPPLPSGYGRKKKRERGERESCGFGPIPEAKVSSSHTSSTSPKKEEDEGAKRNSRLAVAGAKKTRRGRSLHLSTRRRC